MTNKLSFILGPCVLESEALALEIAHEVSSFCKERNISWFFKGSFDKANRSSINSYRGPGLKEGLRILAKVKSTYHVPVLTDIHLPEQAEPVAEVCDVLQIPAFLCRQTDLLVEAGKTGKTINIKKGQFVAPKDMIHAVRKIESTNNKKIILTDRGASFGYNNLVSDFRSIPIMQEFGYPVCYDGTHSVQLPGTNGETTGGDRRFIFPLVKAAVAAGADMIFLETHPEPEKAKSDATNMLNLDCLPKLLDQCLSIYEATRSV
ncbi:MAG: 3-deoxy-8-phosphooctulonate synthase [Chlamydiae bacterium]|nr:3-deoxy-8-phosphooctulonate synthase [Chlamydiota bacterium]